MGKCNGALIPSLPITKKQSSHAARTANVSLWDFRRTEVYYVGLTLSLPAAGPAMFVQDDRSKPPAAPCLFVHAASVESTAAQSSAADGAGGPTKKMWVRFSTFGATTTIHIQYSGGDIKRKVTNASTYYDMTQYTIVVVRRKRHMMYELPFSEFLMRVACGDVSCRPPLFQVLPSEILQMRHLLSSSDKLKLSYLYA